MPTDAARGRGALSLITAAWRRTLREAPSSSGWIYRDLTCSDQSADSNVAHARASCAPRARELMWLNVRRGKSGLREGSALAAGNRCGGVVNPRIYETGNEEAEEASSKSAKMADGGRAHVSPSSCREDWSRGGEGLMPQSHWKRPSLTSLAEVLFFKQPTPEVRVAATP